VVLVSRPWSSRLQSRGGKARSFTGKKLLVYGGRLVDEFLSAGAEEDRVSRVLHRQFNTVEMDATFYGVPSERTVSRWYEQTPRIVCLAATFCRQLPTTRARSIATTSFLS